MFNRVPETIEEGLYSIRMTKVLVGLSPEINIKEGSATLLPSSVMEKRKGVLCSMHSGGPAHCSHLPLHNERPLETYSLEKSLMPHLQAIEGRSQEKADRTQQQVAPG